MAEREAPRVTKFEKARHAVRGDWEYYLPQEDRPVMEELAKALIFPERCERPCTKVLTLFPKDTVAAQTGKGYYLTNVDGFRVINAFVISDPLNSSLKRGFTLELAFSVNPFVYGVGAISETSWFFNFESFFSAGTQNQRTIRCETSDLTTLGGLPWIGGTHLSHILRVPVLGPYARASVFNEDTSDHQVEVKAYLST